MCSFWRPCPWTVNGPYLYGANWIVLITCRTTVLLRCYFLTYGAIFYSSGANFMKKLSFYGAFIKKNYCFTVLYNASTVAYGWWTGSYLDISTESMAARFWSRNDLFLLLVIRKYFLLDSFYITTVVDWIKAKQKTKTGI